MKTLQDAIQEEMDQLHFVKALALLDQLETPTAMNWFQKGLCHAAISAPFQAEQEYEQALESGGSASFLSKVQLRLLALYVQTGQLEKAHGVYRQLEKDQHKPDFLFYKALYLYEMGAPRQALEAALCLAQMEDPTLLKLRCEAWTLCGDLYSALGAFQKGVEAYHEALDLLEGWPPNWRDLRQALILNNLADLYEQFERWDMAQAIYEKAWQAIEKVEDEQIYDLAGYKLEILLSMANFQGLIDEFEAAYVVLDKAKALVKTILRPAYFYWCSRINYIEGLCELYSQNPKYDPFEKLFLAWSLQKTFLSQSLASSKEYLGRTAYYAAYTYNPHKAQGISQRELYDQALSLFQQCLFKDPKFFGFTIASIQNEIGNLELTNNPHQAVAWYSKALDSYERYQADWPEDGFAQSSLLAVLLNLFGAQTLDELANPKNPYRSEALIDRFEKTLPFVWRDPDLHIQAVDALERLLENEKLYRLCPERLEAIHDAFIQAQDLQ